MALKYRPNGRTSRTYVRLNELALIHQTEERKNGCYRMVVGFTTTYAISAYHH